MNKIVFLVVALITVTVLLTGGCQRPPEPLPLIRIGHAPHDHHSPLYVAAMNPGHFKKHGGIYLKEIQFKKEYELISGGQPLARMLVESSTGGQGLIRRLSEEQYDIAFGGVPAILKFIDTGRQIYILAPIMSEGAGLIVRKDLPVKDWEEFLDHVRRREKPLRVGYKTTVSVQNLIFEYALMECGVPFSHELDDPGAVISLINLKGAKHLIPAMENGLIDGFVVMQPYLAMAEAKGSGKLLTLLRDLPPEGKWHGHPCCALAANEHFLKSRPAVAEIFLTLLLRARQFITKHPEKSAQQIARWLDMSSAIEADSLPTIDFTVGLDASWNRGIDFWVNAMVESGRLNAKVVEAYRKGNLSDLIYDRAIYDRANGNLE